MFNKKLAEANRSVNAKKKGEKSSDDTDFFDDSVLVVPIPVDHKQIELINDPATKKILS